MSCRSLSLTLLILAACTTGTVPMQQTHHADWSDVAATLGRSGAVQPGEVYKVSFPRSDLEVSVGGVRIKPALALGSWIAFLPAASGMMAMGDLVLTAPEVNNVISALQAGGIEQTAIHNHLLGESPPILYVHFSGHGDPVALARTLHDALTHTLTPMQTVGGAQPVVDLPTSELDRILGASGRANGGVYQFVLPRAERIVDRGMEIPASAGVATAINFQATGDGRAAITGDFVLTAAEVNPVLRELRNGGIAVTALHSHMLTEQPRLFFMHFWANDDATRLASVLRAALDRIRVKRE